MKFALITPYPPSKTTLNEYGYHLAKQLAAKEEVEKLFMLTEHLEDESAYHMDSENTEFHPCWSFNSLKNPIGILRKILKLKPDVVILNLQFLLFGDKKVAAALGLLIPVLLKILGFKSIVLLHNIMEEVDLSEAGITNNKLMKWVYNFIGSTLTRFILQADLVGVTIDKYVDVLRAKYKSKNVILLPHGAFELPAEPSYKVKKGTKKVMTFGKFGTYKKVEVLIESIAKIRENSDVDVELVIAGTDNPNCVGYLADVQDKYSHIPGITFTGYVEEEDVPTIFKESDVVVFPYTSTTGSSGVLHQTGSYGKSAILPNLGDLGRLIEEEGYAGEYFEPGDSESLATAIDKLLTDDNYRTKVAKQNYEAASGLSLADITDWYLIHSSRLMEN